MFLAVSELALVVVAAGGTALGALVGAVTGGVVDFRLGRAAERRDAKVGARLTRVDLATAASQLKQAEDEAKWWVFYATPMKGWHDHRAALAAQLTSDEFEVVAQAVTELDRFSADMQQAPVQPGTSFRALSQSSVTALNTMRQNATTAYNELARLAEQPTVQGPLHG